MKKYAEKILIVSGFILIGVILYFTFINVYGDAKYINKYFLMHLAFIPVDVILVSFVIEEFLEKRHKEEMLKKFTMVFGIWLRRTGFDIFHVLNKQLKNQDQLSIIFNEQKLCKKMMKKFTSQKFEVSVDPEGIIELKNILDEKIEQLFNIATNPVMSELKESSELLMILLHLHDEFLTRADIEKMGKEDLHHICDDIEKAFKAFLLAWVSYMGYLKCNFPVLFKKNLQMLNKTQK